MSCSIIWSEPSCTLDAAMLPLLSLPSGQEYKPQIALCLTHPESLSESHETAAGWEETLSALSYVCSGVTPHHPTCLHMDVSIGTHQIATSPPSSFLFLPLFNSCSLLIPPSLWLSFPVFCPNYLFCLFGHFGRLYKKNTWMLYSWVKRSNSVLLQNSRKKKSNKRLSTVLLF